MLSPKLQSIALTGFDQYRLLKAGVMKYPRETKRAYVRLDGLTPEQKRERMLAQMRASAKKRRAEKHA